MGGRTRCQSRSTPPTLVFALGLLSGALALEDSDRALALVEEAIDVATRIGELMGAADTTIGKGWLALRRGDCAAALGACVDGLEQTVQLGDAASAQAGFLMCVVAFCELGALEPAVVALGQADARSTRNGHPWAMEMVAAAEATLVHRLGDERVATLAAQGAAFKFRDAVAYVRAEAERAVAAP